ncbi:hypothetical protein AB6A40_001448 [Gnathostoma spinigerum]|uniref:Uncharacterized protein n=1 Tax=Gnathostoma spinigerum TaxID=75299 RepID=A0ABD6E9B7_9BILA
MYVAALSIVIVVISAVSADSFGGSSWLNTPGVPSWQNRRRIRQWQTGPDGGNWQGGIAGSDDPWGNSPCNENTPSCIQHNFKLFGNQGVGLGLPNMPQGEPNIVNTQGAPTSPNDPWGNNRCNEDTPACIQHNFRVFGDKGIGLGLPNVPQGGPNAGNSQGGLTGPNDPWGNSRCNEDTPACIQHNFRIFGDKGIGLGLPNVPQGGPNAGNSQGGLTSPNDPWGNSQCNEDTPACIQHNFRLSGDKGLGLQLPSTPS